jgi:hypothetical protein
MARWDNAYTEIEINMDSARMLVIGAGWHCSQAPDEMRQLAMELQALADQAGLPVPAIRKVLGLG